MFNAKVKRPGFSLLELLLAIALAGTLYTSIQYLVPKRRSGQDVEDFFNGINNLCALAIQESIAKQRPTSLVINQSKKNESLQVKAQILEHSSGGKNIFKTIGTSFIPSKFKCPKNISLVRWWTSSEGQGSGPDLRIYISEEGMTQVVILHLTNTHNGQQQEFSAILNPFLGLFKNAAGFVKIPT